MIDYLIDLWVKVLIFLSCCVWAVSAFWGLIYLAEKILRFVYQDEARQLYTDSGLTEVECEDCSMPILVNELDETWPRCDLCAAIWYAELDKYGFSRADRKLHRELRARP